MESLRGKWIKRCVAENPKKQNDAKDCPDVFGVELISFYGPPLDSGTCKTHEGIKQERQRDNEQGIKLECGYHIAMHQRMHCARAATTGTSKSRQRAERANGENTCFPWLKNKEIDSGNGQGQPAKRGQQTRIYRLSESHET